MMIAEEFETWAELSLGFLISDFSWSRRISRAVDAQCLGM